MFSSIINFFHPSRFKKGQMVILFPDSPYEDGAPRSTNGLPRYMLITSRRWIIPFWFYDGRIFEMENGKLVPVTHGSTFPENSIREEFVGYLKEC